MDACVHAEPRLLFIEAGCLSVTPEFTDSSWPSCPDCLEDTFSECGAEVTGSSTPAWFIPVQNNEDGRSTDARKGGLFHADNTLSKKQNKNTISYSPSK